MLRKFGTTQNMLSFINIELLAPEVFIPMKINTRKGRRANVSKPENAYQITPFSKLLTKAYIMQKRLLENPRISQKEFCELNKSRLDTFEESCNSITSVPKSKKMIMNGWMPKKFSTQQILTGKIPLLWSKQEKMIV